MLILLVEELSAIKHTELPNFIMQKKLILLNDVVWVEEVIRSI